MQAQKNGEGSASTSEGKISVAAAVGVNLQNATARADVPVNVTSAGPLTLAAPNKPDAKGTADGSGGGRYLRSGVVRCGAGGFLPQAPAALQRQ